MSTTPQPPDVWSWIRSCSDFRTVIDIGANVGEYARFLSRILRPQVIYAIEPLTSCQTHLQEAATSLGNMHVLQVAVDDHDGMTTLWENQYAPVSSLLPISDLTKVAFPETATSIPVSVIRARLDDILPVSSLERKIFIKMDVQGVEDRVIRGGRAVFESADTVLVEMSFQPLYEGQVLFEEVHDLLVSCGLRLAGQTNQVGDRTGRPLFAHCVYHRSHH